MTREQMEAYRSKKEEIEELRERLKHLGRGDSALDSSVINDYRKGYPQPQAVVGVNWSRIRAARTRYENRIAKLEQECSEVEEFIESIEDSMMRRIFRLYYIDGLSQKSVAKAVNLDRSSISRKIDKFFKVAHNSQNAQL